MAEEDYTVQDRKVLDADGNIVGDQGKGKTARSKVGETVQATPDADAAAFAAEQGVSRPEYANYAAALNELQEREDIETLASRRARTYGAAFADADYMRLVPGQPGPGSMEGQAPKRDGETVDNGDADLNPAPLGADVYDRDTGGADNDDSTPLV